MIDKKKPHTAGTDTASKTTLNIRHSNPVRTHWSERVTDCHAVDLSKTWTKQEGVI
jgi:hypothetical protein